MPLKKKYIIQTKENPTKNHVSRSSYFLSMENFASHKIINIVYAFVWMSRNKLWEGAQKIHRNHDSPSIKCDWQYFSGSIYGAIVFGWDCSRFCGQQMCIDSFMINGSADKKFNLWMCMPLVVRANYCFIRLGKVEGKVGLLIYVFSKAHFYKS